MIEKEIQQQTLTLTHAMFEHIKGQNSGVAMGALMNLVMTVAQNVPSTAFRGHMAYSFRQIADQLDQMRDPS